MEINKNLLFAWIKNYSILLFTIALLCLQFYFEPWRKSSLMIFLPMLALVPAIYMSLYNCGKEKAKFLIPFFIFIFGGWAAAEYYIFPLNKFSKIQYFTLIQLFIAAYIALFSLAVLFLASDGKDYLKKAAISGFIYILFFPCLIYFSCDCTKILYILYNILFSYFSITQFSKDPFLLNVVVSIAWKSVFMLVCLFFIQNHLPVLKFKPQVKKPVEMLFALSLLVTTYTFFNNQIIAELKKHTNFFSKLMEERSNPLLQQRYRIKANTADGLYFLIVGESHDYHEAEKIIKYPDYFYGRLRSDADFIVFSNVRSPQKSDNYSDYIGESQYSMCHMLSSTRTPQNIWHLLKHHDLFDVLMVSGFKLLWMHNMGGWEKYANLQQHFVRRSDHTFLTTDSSFSGKYAELGFQVDNIIPDELKKIYADNKFNKKRSFMMIKPLGLHHHDIIIPEDFRKKYASLSEYSCGMLYYNSILEKIFSTLKSFPETKAIVYCSDHSFDKDPNQKIVMFVYLSKELKKQKTKLADRVKMMADKPFNTIMMYDFLLEIMDVSVEKQ